MNLRILTYGLFFFVCSIQLVSAQCYPDRHSTTWYDNWMSCSESPNPNSAYGNSHWILYNLGYEYALNDTKIWNLNEPNRLDNGIYEYAIDYSTNGSEWTHLGTYTMGMAPGTSIYEGEEGPDFDGAKAKYVLLTPLTNFGGECFGFSELKMNITDPFEIVDEEIGFNANVFPNPFVDHINLRINTLDQFAPLTYALYDILGREIVRQELYLIEGTDAYQLPVNGQSLTTGIYIFTIEQNGKQRSFKLLKE